MCPKRWQQENACKGFQNKKYVYATRPDRRRVPLWGFMKFDIALNVKQAHRQFQRSISRLRKVKRVLR